MFWKKGRTTAPSDDPVARVQEIEAGYRLSFRRRLEAGVGVTAEEWDALDDQGDVGVLIQNWWLDEREKYELRRRAVEAQFIASALRGNVLNEEAVFEDLPADRQNELLRQRAFVAAKIRKAHRGAS